MKIAKDHVVQIEYKLTGPDGAVLDESAGEPLTYLHGGRNIIPGLERQLEGLVSGDQRMVTVEAGEAYGERSDEMIRDVPKAELLSSGLDNLQVGMQLQGHSPQGVQVFTITNVGAENVTLDGNHPLAGLQLKFDVRVVGVRKATLEELAHGHAHGPGGHHH
jgi:FKBP-type peptidyl-prolyl cis-trans isomerase SlyD